MAGKPDPIPELPKCSKGHDIPVHVVNCVVCGEGVGFPNVRYAERAEERQALERRLAEARISAGARGSADRLSAFGQAVTGSTVVISRSQGDLENMLKGSGALMQAYHPAVRAHLRIPENNEFDPSREMNDSRISPHFFDKLHFGALSLDRRGVPHYGAFAITLRTSMISNRATVFEENPVKFNEAHPPRRGRQVPFGFRAIWEERHKLAVAKLQPKIDPGTTDEDFPDLLLEKVEQPDGYTDFVEVHVYGEIHPLAFEHIVAQLPDDELDRRLWQRLKDRLPEFGISFEEIAS